MGMGIGMLLSILGTHEHKMDIVIVMMICNGSLLRITCLARTPRTEAHISRKLIAATSTCSLSFYLTCANTQMPCHKLCINVFREPSTEQ